MPKRLELWYIVVVGVAAVVVAVMVVGGVSISWYNFRQKS
jgi:Na+-translocating ferredoxin:NAD+ oxidoreductase RnfD subunit